jgi:hypothetical protein
VHPEHIMNTSSQMSEFSTLNTLWKKHMWQPQVELVHLSLLLFHEIQLKSQNSNCVNCDYFTQNGSWAILGKIVIVDTITIVTF